MNNLTNPVKSDCLDCKALVLTGTLVISSEQSEFVIVHSGNGCPGFFKRFGKLGATAAFTEDGSRVPGQESIKRLPKRDDK